MPEKQSNDTNQSETEIFNKIDFEFVPGIHVWKQRGYYLVCTSCDLGHGVFIGPDLLMVGTDDGGKPILKTRKELGMS